MNMNPTKNADIESTPGCTCPVTGLPILRKPEWTDVSFGTDYKTTFSVLGGSILLGQASGYVTLHDMENALELLSKVANEAFAGGRPFVQIEDLSNVHGTSLEARKYLIDHMKKRERLLGLIFCSASPTLKMSINLGKRLNIVKFDVQIANDYSEAVELAVKMLSSGKMREDKPIIASTEKDKVYYGKGGLSHKITTTADWFLQLDGSSVRFEVIDGDILYAINTGFSEEEHIGPAFRLQEKVFNSMALTEGSYYFLVGITKIKGISRKARRLYIDRIKEWYKAHPFQMYIFHGANRLLRAAINIASPLVPFKVRMVKDLDSALKLIAEEKAKSIKPASLPTVRGAVREPIPSDQIQQYVDELLQYLVSINWETDGFAASTKVVDPAHPFAPVFDAIALDKSDLDDLFRERMRAEEGLAEERNLLRTVIDNLPDIVYAKDTESRFVIGNIAVARLIGTTTPDELLGKTDFDFYPQELAAQYYANEQEIIRSGQPLVNREEPFMDQVTGERGWLSTTKVLLRDGHGKIVGLVGIGRDITERKRAEEEVRRLNEGLGQRVIERTTELRAANKELGAFAYSVAHELRSPLRSVDGFSLAILEDYGDGMDAQCKDYFGRIRAASQRMARLIDDLLRLSHITRCEIHREMIDLSALAWEIATKLQARQPERRVEFVIKGGLAANGDAVLLQVVLENLLGNAWKFTARHHHARIEFGVAQHGDEMAYFVRDDGAGFDMAYVDKIFGIFQRLHAMTEFEGTGTGLATVQRIIHRHGGQVWTEGTVQQGATFYFTL